MIRILLLSRCWIATCIWQNTSYLCFAIFEWKYDTKHLKIGGRVCQGKGYFLSRKEAGYWDLEDSDYGWGKVGSGKSSFWYLSLCRQGQRVSAINSLILGLPGDKLTPGIASEPAFVCYWQKPLWAVMGAGSCWNTGMSQCAPSRCHASCQQATVSHGGGRAPAWLTQSLLGMAAVPRVVPWGQWGWFTALFRHEARMDTFIILNKCSWKVPKKQRTLSKCTQ